MSQILEVREGVAKRAKAAEERVEEIVDAEFDVGKFVENFEVIAEAAGGARQLRSLVRALGLRGRLTSAGLELPVSPSDIPPTWRWVRLDEAADWAGGSGFPKQAQGHGDRPLLFCKVSDMNLPGNERFIERTVHTIDDATARRVRAKIHPIGTVIFPKIGGAIATNKRRILRFPGAIDNNCLGLTPNGQCTSDYLLLFMQSVDLTLYQNDGPVPALNQGRIGAIEVPVAPLAEQKRIVARVDQLMALCDDLEARQNKKRETGTRLTKSALEALTTAEGPEEFDVAWKRVVENFDVIVDRAEKVGEVRTALRRLALRGRLARADGERRAGEGPWEIPVHWGWRRADELCEFITKGTTPTAPQMTEGSGEVPFLKVYNLTFDGTVDFTVKPTFISALVHRKELARSLVLPGDVLMNIVGPPLGKVSIVSGDYREWNINQAIARFRPKGNIIASFLALCLLDVATLMSFGDAEVRGTAGQDNISLAQCRQLLLPVPPVNEQREIVARIGIFMKLCNDFEARLRRAENRSAKLAEAVAEELVA